MERLIVDTEGKIVIPPEVTHRRGLRPGDEVAIAEAEQGLMLYLPGIDAETLAWWNDLSEAERLAAREEADRYFALSEAERDALWEEEPVSLAKEAEGDEIELPVRKHTAR